MTPRPREIWTRLVIDPLADPLARRLAPLPGVTPDRVTAVAAVLGAAAVVCLGIGELRIGGALFLLRFFADCLDGKVARLQRSSTARGAALDIATDTLTVTGAYAAVCWWAVDSDRLDAGWAVALLGVLGGYGWALAYRKHLAERAGMGDGGADHSRHVEAPVLGAWVALCRRLGMSPVPWAVEAETLCLGLLPLTGVPVLVAAGVQLALGFYVVALVVNLARVRRIAARLDLDAVRTAVPR